MLKVLYFAWVRERTGISREDIALPDDATTVASLMAGLRARGAGYAEAFAEESLIRAAVNQEHVDLAHALKDGDEVAFFPPVTGG